MTLLARWAFLALTLTGLTRAQTIDAPLGEPPRVSRSEQVARRFYDAFCVGDLATLEQLYAPDVRFKDEIFAFQDRAGTMGMWGILLKTEGAKFRYEFLSAEGETAKVRWLADYEVFGRPVHNVIEATLTIREGRIVEHRDAFSWERWSRQALPLGGLPTWGPAEHVIKFAIRTSLAWQVRAARKRAVEQPTPATPGLTGGLQR